MLRAVTCHFHWIVVVACLGAAHPLSAAETDLSRAFTLADVDLKRSAVIAKPRKADVAPVVVPLDAALFRRLWAAYLEPDLNLLGEADAHAYTHYVLAYGVRIDRPGLSLVRSLPGGGLYRIGPP